MSQIIYFLIKMIVVIFAMKYGSDILIAFITKENPKKKRKWSDPYFRDEIDN